MPDKNTDVLAASASAILATSPWVSIATGPMLSRISLAEALRSRAASTPSIAETPNSTDSTTDHVRSLAGVVCKRFFEKRA